MVNLAEALAVLLPDAEPLRDYVVTDDGTGRGAILSAWHLPGEPPTVQQILAVTDAQVSAARLARESVAAVTWFATSMDPTAVALRVIVRDLYTRHNDSRERDGLGRVLEPDIVARLVGMAKAGYGTPIDV